MKKALSIALIVVMAIPTVILAIPFLFGNTMMLRREKQW